MSYSVVRMDEGYWQSNDAERFVIKTLQAEELRILAIITL